MMVCFIFVCNAQGAARPCVVECDEVFLRSNKCEEFNGLRRAHVVAVDLEGHLHVHTCVCMHVLYAQMYKMNPAKAMSGQKT